MRSTWHWPLLAAARLVALPAVEPPPWLLLGAVILAIVIATASTLFMEEPIRSSTWATFRGRRAIGLALGSMVVVAVTSAALITWTPGAMTARGSLEDALVAARHDRSRLLDDGCFSATTAKAKLKDCIYGAGARPDGSPGHGQPEQPVVVLVGDSHAMSWFAAIDDWASNRGLALVPLTRSGCRAGLSDPAESRDSAKCTAWAGPGRWNGSRSFAPRCSRSWRPAAGRGSNHYHGRTRRPDFLRSGLGGQPVDHPHRRHAPGTVPHPRLPGRPPVRPGDLRHDCRRRHLPPTWREPNGRPRTAPGSPTSRDQLAVSGQYVCYLDHRRPGGLVRRSPPDGGGLAVGAPRAGSGVQFGGGDGRAVSSLTAGPTGLGRRGRMLESRRDGEVA